MEIYPVNAGRLLIADQSERSSRDAAEFSYLAFKWNSESAQFCLHASVSGTPSNQLRGELIPSEVVVNRYAHCITPKDRIPETTLTADDARSLALIESGNIRKSQEMPEYLAFELARIVDNSTVTDINNAAFFQEQSGFLYQALIILDSINLKFPKRAPAKINLADTYWKLGAADKACVMYKAYLSSVEVRKRPRPKRAVERSKPC